MIRGVARFVRDPTRGDFEAADQDVVDRVRAARAPRGVGRRYPGGSEGVDEVRAQRDEIIGLDRCVEVTGEDDRSVDDGDRVGRDLCLTVPLPGPDMGQVGGDDMYGLTAYRELADEQTPRLADADRCVRVPDTGKRIAAPERLDELVVAGRGKPDHS